MRPGQKSRYAEVLLTRPAIPGCAISLTAALLAAGCGGSDEPGTTKPASTQPPPPALQGGEHGVLATIDELQRASSEGKSSKICRDLFTADLRRSIEAASKRTCATEVRTRLFDSKTSISVERNIQIDGTKAKAVILEPDGRTSTLQLLRQGDAWRIDRVSPGEG